MDERTPCEWVRKWEFNERLEEILRSRGGMGAIPEQVSVDSDGGNGWLVTVHVNADQGPEALCRVIDSVSSKGGG